jgi:hypothetical protein
LLKPTKTPRAIVKTYENSQKNGLNLYKAHKKTAKTYKKLPEKWLKPNY